MVSTTASYLALSRNLAVEQAAAANDPQVKSATAYYLANIGKVHSIEDFVGDHRLFAYAMTAHGLADRVFAKGLMTKVLEGGITNQSALAATLGDPRYMAFATAFDFAGRGPSATRATAATTDTISNFIAQAFEDHHGRQNPGVQLALYFTRNARAASDCYGLLADGALRQVVEMAFGLPASTDIVTQAKTLGEYVSTTDLQDPRTVRQIAERFTIMWDFAGNAPSVQDASIPQPSETPNLLQHADRLSIGPAVEMGAI